MSEFNLISDDVFPPEAIWIENGKTFGCPWIFKTCIQMCCARGHAILTENCTENLFTVRGPFGELYENRDVYLFIDEPCSTNDSLFRYYSGILKAEWDFQTYIQATHGLTRYCLHRGGAVLIRLLGICIHEGSTDLLIWALVCENISMLFAVATFIVYSVIPELKNSKGSKFRCYLASYVCCMILLTTALLSDVPDQVNLTGVIFLSINLCGLLYFGVASLLWLNVMSLDIWRTFRKLRPPRDMNNLDLETQQKKKFIRYSIYAWCAPAVVTIPVLNILVYEIPKFTSFLVRTFPYFSIALILGVTISNTCLYISTALTINKRKKETVDIVEGVNKHRQENEQWFNLYLKLFVIMGGPLVFWATGISWHNQILWRIIYLVEALQGISIFFIFVWKDDVKRLIRKRFDEVLRTLRSYLRSGSTPTTEN